jgi:hypothetical protein
MKDRKVKQILSRGWYQWDEGQKEGVKEDKYGGGTIYSGIKWKNEACWNCSKEGGRGDNGERWREWIKLRYTVFCNCYNVVPVQA